MTIEDRWFRRASEGFLVMRRMLAAYRSLLRTHQQLLNKYKALSEAERNVLRPAIKSLEEQMYALAKQIAMEAGKRYPAYNMLVEGWGIGDSASGREALAELLTYADFASSPLRGLKRLMGLYRPVKSSKRRHWRLYDGGLHQAATRLAMAYHKNRPSGRQCWELVKRIKQLVTTQTPGGPGSEGKTPEIYTRSFNVIIAGSYSPAGCEILIPVSGVPRLAADSI